MSLAAYIWAAELPYDAVGLRGYRILLRFADRADELGYAAWPSVETIAETLHCSVRTVQRGIQDLLDAGLIREGDQRPVAHIRADRRPVVYDVLTPALRYAESHVSSVTPSDSRGDNSRPNGVTTAVTPIGRTALEPTYQDSPRELTLVTTRVGEKSA